MSQKWGGFVTQVMWKWSTDRRLTQLEREDDFFPGRLFMESSAHPHLDAQPLDGVAGAAQRGQQAWGELANLDADSRVADQHAPGIVLDRAGLDLGAQARLQQRADDREHLLRLADACRNAGQLGVCLEGLLQAEKTGRGGHGRQLSGSLGPPRGGRMRHR